MSGRYNLLSFVKKTFHWTFFPTKYNVCLFVIFPFISILILNVVIIFLYWKSTRNYEIHSDTHTRLNVCFVRQRAKCICIKCWRILGNDAPSPTHILPCLCACARINFLRTCKFFYVWIFAEVDLRFLVIFFLCSTR